MSVQSINTLDPNDRWREYPKCNPQEFAKQYYESHNETGSSELDTGFTRVPFTERPWYFESEVKYKKRGAEKVISFHIPHDPQGQRMTPDHSTHDMWTANRKLAEKEKNGSCSWAPYQPVWSSYEQQKTDTRRTEMILNRIMQSEHVTKRLEEKMTDMEQDESSGSRYVWGYVFLDGTFSRSNLPNTSFRDSNGGEASTKPRPPRRALKKEDET